jgi:23S rRNA (cytosine1962-C5)-methyltransferase
LAFALCILQFSGEDFDLIVLDPPSFTRTKREHRDALKGYKELNLKP